MSTPLTIECSIHIEPAQRGRRELKPGEPPPVPQVEPGRVLRVARLMALAIRFERMVREGAVKDYADLARLGQVTRARVTQIMNLNLLAPDIQEAVLYLPRTLGGRDPVILADLQPIALTSDWRKQRQMWKDRLARQGREK